METDYERTKAKWALRRERIMRMVAAGKTLAAIADSLGVTRQAVHHAVQHERKKGKPCA